MAGDFNATRWSNAFELFRNRSGLVHMKRILPTWPVWPLPVAQLGLDHVFATPDIGIEECYTGSARRI